MTEQEGQVWAARLTRIWVPETEGVTQEDWLPQWVVRNRSFTYSTKVTPTVRLTYRRDYSPGTDTIFLLRRQEGERTGYLSCFIERAIVDFATPNENESLFHQFDLEWRNPFRRGCWLSGVDIKASAHEKAE